MNSYYQCEIVKCTIRLLEILIYFKIVRVRYESKSTSFKKQYLAIEEQLVC